MTASILGIPTVLDARLRPGIPVVLDAVAPDGEVLAFRRPAYIVLGTRPRTELELVAWQARYIVQSGLRDIMEWIGEPVIPEHPPTSAAILAGLRQLAQRSR